MALTLEAEQRLHDVGLVAFYDANEQTWKAVVEKVYGYVKANFPAGSKIRRDDLTKAFVPILEVNEALRDKLDADRIRGKFWITDFANLIIDRAWDDLV